MQGPLTLTHYSGSKKTFDWILLFWDPKAKIGTSSKRSVGWRFGGRLATTLVATLNDIIFFFLFLSCLLFSSKECSDQKKYLDKVDGSA